MAIKYRDFGILPFLCHRMALVVALSLCGTDATWAAWSVTGNPTPVSSGAYTRLWTAQDSVTFGKVKMGLLGSGC